MARRCWRRGILAGDQCAPLAAQPCPVKAEATLAGEGLLIANALNAVVGRLQGGCVLFFSSSARTAWLVAHFQRKRLETSFHGRMV